MARVLIVDDSPSHLLAIQRVVEKLGHSVITAEDGDSAMKLVDTKHPDLIVMDIAMPSMDGVTAARRIRAQSGTMARVPIVFMTALAASGDRDTALAAGGNDYLVKPISDRELLAVVRRYAKRSEGPDS